MFRKIAWPAVWGGGLICLLILPIEIALPFPSAAEEPLALSDLINEARLRNPEIAAAARALESARSRIPQAGSWPDPMLSFEVQNIGGSWSVGEEEMSMAGLSVSQMVPFPGKPTLNEAAARHEAAQMEAMQEETQRRVIAELKRLYFELYRIQRSRPILDETQQLIEMLIATAQVRYSVGEGTQQDVLGAQAELIRLTDRRVQIIQQEETLKAEINSLLLRPPDSPLGEPELLRPPLPSHGLSEFEEAALSQSPMLQASDSRAAARERMLAMARRDRFPDIELSLGYFDRGEFENLYTAMVSLNLPVYYRSRQGARIREAEADLAGARSDTLRARQRVRQEVNTLHREITTTHRLLELIEQGLLPQARFSFESAKAGYEVGQVNFLTLLTSLTAWLEDEIGALEMLSRYQTALAEMEALTGWDLIGRGDG